MQLINSPIPHQAIGVARGSLAQSDAMRGLSAMTPPNTGMFNADDGGAMSKPYINAQPTENQALAMQTVTQNGQTQAPQAIAGVQGAMTKGMTEQSTAEYKAQTDLAANLTRIIEERGGGDSLMRLNARYNSPDRESFVNNIATTQAMAMNMAPELGALQAQERMYG